MVLARYATHVVTRLWHVGCLASAGSILAYLSRRPTSPVAPLICTGPTTGQLVGLAWQFWLPMFSVATAVDCSGVVFRHLQQPHLSSLSSAFISLH